MVWVAGAALFAALAPVLFLAERIAPESPDAGAGKRRCPGRSARVTDWSFAAIGLAVIPAVWLAISAIAGVIVPHTPLHAVFANLPRAAGSASAFVLADLAAYWIHRLEHRIGPWWRFHSVHHSPEHLDWLSGRRFHPLDIAAQQLYPIAVVGALGVPLASLAPYLIVATVVTVLAHCDLALPAGPLGWLVVTPGYHRSHHEVGRGGSNFALVLPVMDLLFGTASMRVGVRSFGTGGAVPAAGVVKLLAWGVGIQCRERAHRTKTSSPAQNDTALAT